MENFKVCDRVRIVKRNPGNKTGDHKWNEPNGDVGRVGSITGKWDTGECRVEGDDHYLGYFSDDELEHADYPFPRDMWTWTPSISVIPDMYGVGATTITESPKKKTTMQKVKTMFKRLTDNDTQTLYKAGFINGDLELTDAGKTALWGVLFDANKAALVQEAQTVLDEETKQN